MFKKGKLINQAIAILFLAVYCFSLFALLLHHYDHHHYDHHHLGPSHCSEKNKLENLCSDKDCSHNMHVESIIETCEVCECFYNQDKKLLNNFYQHKALFSNSLNFTTCPSLYLACKINLLNKSPPFFS